MGVEILKHVLKGMKFGVGTLEYAVNRTKGEDPWVYHTVDEC